MEKKELVNEIESLPKFEKLEVRSIKGDSMEGEVTHRQDHFRAIVPVDGTEAISMVNEGYELVQFSEVFKPIVENLGSVEGNVYSYKGKGILELFPKEEEIGIVVRNSVDKSWALRLNFIVKLPQELAYIPKKVYGFRHLHRGSAFESYERFTYTLAEVKSAWKMVVERMSEIKMDAERLKELKKALKVGKLLEKVVEEIFREGMSLWEFFVKYIEEISKRKYKSMIHQRQRLSRVSEVIIGYAVALRLGA